MKRVILAATLALTGLTAGPVGAAPQKVPARKPAIVLVHGAFADTSSWNKVVTILQRDGYYVISVANPLRGVRSDANYVANVVAALKAPVVLVGHSYGGSVISEAAEGQRNVKALVYVSAFAPEVGETAAGLSAKFPGSTLAATLYPPVPLTGGGKDLYIIPARFPAQFAADVAPAEARLMAADQRPITAAALNEPTTAPAWKHIASFSVYGDQDKNIPPKALAFMAQRARMKQSIVIKGGSHVVMVSHPDVVARLIETAAQYQPAK
ncbi:alpha/beta hydrolase [Sphingobium sp. PNB]|uniref:alpha/beta fold hydrolase n=1 Tax=Sphingobium sp. PNB TaxID=863934 RepID=UPI001CA411C2|nr:alpha/beta hydrolase [Sphingobium sp. PNB]MCB4859650.1 alpha/beta hydrolase [Sphingobium sp. PNB]